MGTAMGWGTAAKSYCSFSLRVVEFPLIFAHPFSSHRSLRAWNQHGDILLLVVELGQERDVLQASLRQGGWITLRENDSRYDEGKGR